MTGDELHRQIVELYPLMRSITGDGTRQTLRHLAGIAPIETFEVASGTPVLDWTVPDEWVFRHARLTGPDGSVVADSDVSTLHVVNYSVGVDETLDRADLDAHLFSLPDRPSAIPYRTSYYQPTWGFGLTDTVRQGLGDGPYRAVIDAEHRADGGLSYGELVIPGSGPEEILVSTHICHPSLANDNLSGLVLAAALAAELTRRPLERTWRFVFVPGTIGAITWLARQRADRPEVLERNRGVLVLTGLGDESPFHWKRTRLGTTWIDRVVELVLAQSGHDHTLLDFSPYGYDERQYGSLGFGLAAGRLGRAVHGTYPEYHTSLDDPGFVRPDRLAESLDLLGQVVDALDAERTYVNRQPYGEPQLGRRGLYGSLGALPSPGDAQMAMLWLLSLSDGDTPLSAIAQRSGLPMTQLAEVAELLRANDLLGRTEPPPG
ncbi:MAG: DUF4910 domain-containing protein [Acidimicrobiales bacterium]